MIVMDPVASEASRTHRRRLLVTVRPGDEERVGSPRMYAAIGILSCFDEGYEFAYIPEHRRPHGFTTIPGFTDTARTYESTTLFPAFAQRVMSAHRPDRPRFLEAINLDEASEPWEILSRSGGRRGGDTIELMEEPLVDPEGLTTATFLVHGVGHRGAAASARICELEEGDPLRLEVEPTNPVNSRAVFVTAEGTPLGYVPDPLVDYVNTVIGADYDVRVVRANGPEVSPHLRLLVRLEGRVSPGYVPFG